MECWEKIKSFFKRPKPEVKVAEKKAARAPKIKAARAPKKKAGSSRGKH